MSATTLLIVTGACAFVGALVGSWMGARRIPKTREDVYAKEEDDSFP